MGLWVVGEALHDLYSFLLDAFAYLFGHVAHTGQTLSEKIEYLVI